MASVELLPREEVALLLGSLTACGFLVLGILDVLWPPVDLSDLEESITVKWPESV